MKKMNKKGFTLIELLAVIVVLAIVMVIATQKITDVINSSRSNAFISSYKMIVKQINTNIVADPNNITCASTKACKKIYDISADYELTVEDMELKNVSLKYYKIELSASSDNSKFKNLDLMNYGDAKNKTTNAENCNMDKVDSSVENITDTTNNIIYKAECTKNKIVGYVAK